MIPLRWAIICRLALLIGGLGLAYAIVLALLHVPALLLLILVACWFNRSRFLRLAGTPFGSACFASLRDVIDAGMLNGTGGIPLGAIDSGSPTFFQAWWTLLTSPWSSSDAACQFFLAKIRSRSSEYDLSLQRFVHLAIFAPPAKGKTTGLIIPTLMSYAGPVVVNDLKGECFRNAAEYRWREFGRRAIVIDPFHVCVRDSDGMNPLEFFDPESLLDDARAIAESFVVRTGQEREPHWADMSEFVIFVITAFVLKFAKPADRNLQSVRDILSDAAARDEVARLLTQSTDYDGILARLGHQLANLQGNELSSIMSSITRFLSVLDSPAVAANTRQSTFDPSQLPGGDFDVYLILPPDRLRTHGSALFRLWIGTFLRAIIRRGPRELDPVLFLIDEAAALGHMRMIDDAIAQLRGYGVRMAFCYQSMGQLKACFPEGQDQTFLSCIDTQIFLGPPNDYSTAEYISKRLGDTTVQVYNVQSSESQSWSAGGFGSESANQVQYSTNQSRGVSQHGRRLLKEEEILNSLSDRCAIVFTPGLPPLMTYPRRHYEQHPSQSKGSLARLVVTAATIVVGGILAALAATDVTRSTFFQSPKPEMQAPPDVIPAAPGFRPLPPPARPWAPRGW